MKKKSVWRNVNIRTTLLILTSVVATVLSMIFIVYPNVSINAQNGNILFPIVFLSGVITLLITILAYVLFKMFIHPFYRKMAYNDFLTLAKNRNAFELDLAALEFEKESIKNVNIIVYELHNVKEINETLGNDIGDNFIKETAQIIMGIFDSIGNTYRIGGDEFASIVIDTDQQILDKHLNDFTEKMGQYCKNKLVSLSVSWGSARFTPSQGETLRETYINATKAMRESAHGAHIHI